MRLLLRRIFVILIALGFIAGGFGRMALATAGGEPCHPKSDVIEQHMHEHGATHATHDHTTHDHATHDHAAHHHHKQSGDSEKTADECFKCCGICTAGPQLAATNAPGNARLIGYRISYYVFAESWADRPLRIDPGIPKRIA